ncbi:fimbria/pilus outer membrane usher protein [Dyella japonica]|uniref:fimbria/pilus outer membrane usher protein n=1 Tax=Dyella japonica TaxID=231455 RepID=UPI0002E26C6E|nr:fimbria/pilus outer membrane usher protein [Dyella japonica]
MFTQRYSSSEYGNRTNHALRNRCLPLFIMTALGSTSAWAVPAAPAPAAAAPEPAADPGAVEFSNAFTGTGQSSVDVSRFEQGVTVLPGNYNVDIFVNEGRIARQNMTFRAVDGMKNAQPCFTYAEMAQMGVDVSKLDPSTVNAQNVCIAISDVSPAATAKMDMGELRLDVSIPQESLLKRARGYVSPELWEQGETAFLLGYNFNAYSINQSYSGPRNSGGTAVGTDGSLTQVQNNAYYVPTGNGGFTPSANGNYMLANNGTYVPVQIGSYTPSNNGGYKYNDINAYLGLNLGLNVAGWRVRSVETAQWDQNTGRTTWHNFNTTATHDITPWKAQLTIGDSYTQGIVFDTTPFRGLTIYSDDRMLPDSEQGFAPVVRGVANTQARVEVRQNGNLLYETTVAPGPFTISDLYSTGYGGDLKVTVFEADGTTHTFTVPYSAVPMLLRPGVSRWAITDGQVRDTSLQNGMPYFVEGTYQRGINNWLTLYAGVQSTYRNLYHSYLGGAAINTPVGAFALDVTNSHTTLKGADSSLSGYSTRLSYSKAIPTSGTTLAVASYRYSNGNFLSLTDAVQTQDQLISLRDTSNWAVPPVLRSKQRLQVTLNQDFGGRGGQLYFNGARNTYWNGMPDATTYQLGYTNTYRRVNFGITASRTYSSSPMFNGSRYDNQFGLNVSIPLGGPSSKHAPMLSTSLQHDDTMGNNDRVGINGTFGDRSQYTYNGNVNYTGQGNSSTTASGNMGWQAAYGNLNGGYSYSNHYQQGSVGASGGLVVHGGGVTLAPQIDLTSPIAIIEAPDAKGARVSSSGQTKIDSRGYAVATSLMPYRMNDVTLDPTSTSMDVELQTTRVQTAPRAGAVVPLKFNTVSGRAALIRAKQPNGDALPFGAEVLDASGNSVGTVGQGGQMFVRGAEDGGTLLVRWGDSVHEQCKVQYQLPARAKGQASSLQSADAVCR